jgi:hypothetical protein
MSKGGFQLGTILSGLLLHLYRMLEFDMVACAWLSRCNHAVYARDQTFVRTPAILNLEPSHVDRMRPVSAPEHRDLEQTNLNDLSVVHLFGQTYVISPRARSSQPCLQNTCPRASFALLIAEDNRQKIDMVSSPPVSSMARRMRPPDAICGRPPQTYCLPG